MYNTPTHLSVISPVYQAELLLDELIEKLIGQLSSMTEQFEIILVDDGSHDGSWKKIEEHCAQEPRIKGIQLSRNFGQHPAIAAGIEAASGEWVVVMDCDLQDRPEEIHALYHKAQEGYDVVLARRVRRQDHWLARWSSKLFYRILSFLSGVRYDSTIANFGIYHRRVIHPMRKLHHSIGYFPAMVHWVGFTQSSISVDHAERPQGKSSYNFAKKFRLAVQVMLAYSDKLLRLIIGFGLIISATALCGALLILYRALQGTIPVAGYASLIVSVFFLSGVTIFVLGILGLYIGRIFDSHHTKPMYLVHRKLNASPDSLQ